MGDQPLDIQFERAEPNQPSAPVGATCAACGIPLSAYYEVNGKLACERCKDATVASRAASHVPTLLHAAFLGVLAAAVGAGIYYGIAEVTGYEFGLMSIVLGLMVGFAVRKGSRRRGGWRYQALAMFLCYAAICSTYVPRVVAAIREKEVAKGASKPPAAAVAAPAPSGAATEPAASTVGASAPRQVSFADFLKALAIFSALILALPFLGGVQNIMGLIIIGIGLYEAWKVNRAPPFSVSGPFAVGESRSG
jgi:hypothetical protein